MPKINLTKDDTFRVYVREDAYLREYFGDDYAEDFKLIDMDPELLARYQKAEEEYRAVQQILWDLMKTHKF